MMATLKGLNIDSKRDREKLSFLAEDKLALQVYTNASTTS